MLPRQEALADWAVCRVMRGLGRSPPGGQCRVSPAGHPRPDIWACGNSWLDLAAARRGQGHSPETSEGHRWQMASVCQVAGGDLHRRRLRTRGRTCIGRHGGHPPGHLPAQLPVAPRPPAGRGVGRELLYPGLGRWGRPGTLPTRPRFRSARPMDWPRKAPATMVIRQAGLPPAAFRIHFLRESCADAGANYGPTAGSHSQVSVCRMDVRFSITIGQHKSRRNLIEAIQRDAWIPTGCLDGTSRQRSEP